MSLDHIALAGKKAKGKRPYYFDNPDVDRVLSITMAIAGELAVSRERIDTLERVLESKGLLNQQDIDSFSPSSEQAEQRGLWQQEFIARILRVVQQEREAVQEQAKSGCENDLEEISQELGKI